MKVGVLIPTRGDRPQFVAFAKAQLSRQTRKPDEVLFFDEPPKSNVPDITYRYRKGCEVLKERGCDFIIFWEDDDYYKPQYIERMLSMFRPGDDIVGGNSTIYYNIFTRKWVSLHHPGRASMMHTAIRTKALDKLVWPADDYKWVDIHLWGRLKGNAFNSLENQCVGIKHGMGMCGGGGHVRDWAKFDRYDPQYHDLLQFTDELAVKFYSSLTAEVKRVSLKSNPLLSIITRVMLGKRNGLFENHQRSVESLNSTDYEQIFIIDRHGAGMLNANKSFQFANPEGEWVYLLDDDDFLTNPDFIDDIKNHQEADVIFFKAKIKTGDGDEMYPKPGSWRSREPKRGQIGGGCGVFRKWVFDRYIHHFGLQSFGDWNFYTRVLADKEVKAAWVDKKIVETGKVSRGEAQPC